MVDEFAQLKQTFFEECEELLGSLETQLMALKEGGTDEELLHEAFRAIHSIKGGAGVFGFDRLISFAHTFEAVLDLMRAGRIGLTEEMVFAAISASDVLADLVRAASSEEELAEGYEDAVAADLAAAAGIDADTESQDDQAAADDDQAAADEGTTGSATYCVSFRPSTVMLQRNNEPLLIMRELKELGELTVTADLSALPAFEDLEPAGAYLGWEFELVTSADRAAVERVFEFVEGDCELVITVRGGVAAVDADLAAAAGIDADTESQDDQAAADDDQEAADDDQAAVDEGTTGFATYCVSFRPGTVMLQRNNEPLLIVRELKELGELTVTADLSALPAFEDLEPTGAYLGWEFELVTSADRAAVERVFEFVEGDCELVITVRGGAAAVDEVRVPEVIEEHADGEPAVPAELAVDEAETSSNDPETVHVDAAPMDTSIRVQVERIDSLVNMVGEIVIAQSMISQQIDQRLIDSDPVLVQGLLQLLQYTQSLQDSVMAIRAQPIRSIFARMPRLVRNLSTETGKKIRLVTSGEATEIDKTVIEQLNDPLTHMIRNAVDHGIESSEERVAKGKPAEGTIHLRAQQQGSRIVIEIHDDGRGVDRDMVRKRAIDQNLISGDANLTDEEIDNLIFLPGFSTVETVSNISGRGVGMNVVKQNIKNLGGRVSIRSKPGHGSRFVLTLPLTLAVLDGMIIRVGTETLIIPITNIIQSLPPRHEDLKRVSGSGEMLNFRGDYIMLIDLDRALGIASDDKTSGKLVIVVEIEGGRLVGLIVDEIIGQQQIVIKSLEENFGTLPGIAGATILGDGEVALILDVTAIYGLHQPHKPSGPRPRGVQRNVEEYVG